MQDGWCPRSGQSGLPDRGFPCRRVLSVFALGAAAATPLLVAPPPVTGGSESARASFHAPLPPRRSSCLACHQIDQTFSHPVDFFPTRPLPERFPLSNGRFTCFTCHEIEPSTHPAADPDHFLRTHTSGTAFCAQCHSRTDPSRTNMHALVLGMAHTRLPDRHTTQAPPDFKSSTCLTCHDGSVAINIDHPDRRVASMPTGDHPFDVRYEPSGAYGSIPLKSRASIDERVRIHDGRIDCGSCHSLYSPLDNLIVTDNERSALCLQCHDY